MSRIGQKVPLPEEHHFTKGSEVDARDKQTDALEPTAFKQIPPEDNPGINVASKSFSRKGGALKFSNYGG